MSEDEREDLLDSLSADIPKLYPEHLNIMFSQAAVHLQV